MYAYKYDIERYLAWILRTHSFSQKDFTVRSCFPTFWKQQNPKCTRHGIIWPGMESSGQAWNHLANLDFPEIFGDFPYYTIWGKSVVWGRDFIRPESWIDVFGPIFLAILKPYKDIPIYHNSCHKWSQCEIWTIIDITVDSWKNSTDLSYGAK